MSRLESFKCLPSLVVFDLDYTLWPFWVDTHPTPPFTLKSEDPKKIVDSAGQSVDIYPDSDAILRQLHGTPGVTVACASRTMAFRPARQLLQLTGWQDLFSYVEIFPGSKIAHFKSLKKSSGIDFRKMLFFDDELRNIKEVSSLGVTCVHADDGISWTVLEQGLKEFENKCK